MDTKFSRVVHSDDSTPPTKSRDTLILWSSDKWKALYLHFHKASRSQTSQSGDLGWRNPTHKVRWYMNYVVTWEIKDVLAPLSQGLWTPNLAAGDLEWGTPTHKVTWYMSHVVTWQIKDVISPLYQALWIANLAGYWLLSGCYNRGLRRRKLDNPSISLLLSFVVKKSMLYQMLKKPPRYNGKLVLTKNKHKNAN